MPDSIGVEGGNVGRTEKTRKTHPVVIGIILSGLSPIPWWWWYLLIFLFGSPLCPQLLWMLLGLQLLSAEDCLSLQVTLLEKSWPDPMQLLLNHSLGDLVNKWCLDTPPPFSELHSWVSSSHHNKGWYNMCYWFKFFKAGDFPLHIHLQARKSTCSLTLYKHMNWK